MTDTTEDENISKVRVTDCKEFTVKLEKAAEVFLKLLQECQHYKISLSSISVLCKIVQFIQHGSDFEHAGVKQVRTHIMKAQLNKKRTRNNQADVTDIATAVKMRRKMKSEQMVVSVKTESTPRRKSKRRTRYTVIKKRYKKNVPVQKHVDTNDDEGDNNHSKPDTTKHSLEDTEAYDRTVLSKTDQLSEVQCSYCYKVFIDRRNLKSHLWVHERQKNFQCDVCKKVFLRSHQLTRHKRVHTGEKPYPCAVCGKAFADISNLNTHKRKEHPNHSASLLRCEICGMGCQTRRDLKAHLAAHEEDRTNREDKHNSDTDFQQLISHSLWSLQPEIRDMVILHKSTDKDIFQCQICGKSVNKRAALLAHMKRHISEKHFRCEFCKKTFTELRQLKCHRTQHTGDRPYKCEKCGKGFKSQGTLRSHLGIHSGEQPYSCDVCGRTFSQTSGLNQHKLKHTAEEERTLSSTRGDDKHSCGICGRCYKTNFRLQLHLQSHDSNRDVSCDFCDKRFQTVQELAIHHRSHTKDKYSCRVCGVSFKSRSVYYFHTRTHQIDRPYLCSSCGKSFISVNDLKTHKRRHRTESDPRKPFEQFICNVCGRIYQMKNSLLIHMKIHQGIFDHPCDFCEKKFKSHAELRHHRRVHTQEKPYACQTCERKFSRHSTLVNHQRTHSGERPYMCTSCGAAFKLSCTLKKHTKIHTRDGQGRKARKSKYDRAESQLQEQAPFLKAKELHQHQLQEHRQPEHQQEPQLQHKHESQQLQPTPTSLLMNPHDPLAPQLIAETVPMLVKCCERTQVIHELKPASSSVTLMNNSDLVHNRVDTLLLGPRHSNPCLIQNNELTEADERETPINLIEMQNVVPNTIQYNSGGSSFTAYYYY